MSGALEQGFLSDIVANIDDDTPRLVYADWLMENGRDDRAEFIRVQIERARLPAWDAGQVRLRLRENELLRQHGEAWLAELPAVEGARWEGFRRGVVAEVSFASYEAMRQGAHACRAAAPVEAVTVRWPREREAGQDIPPIAELRELSLNGRPNGLGEVALLADSPQLATLRCLTARGLWAEGFGRLAASPHLGRLKALRLPSNNLGNAGVVALVGAASLSGVEELDLSGVGVSDRYAEDPAIRAPGMEALASWAGLAGVRSLSLTGNGLGRPSLQALLRSPHAAALKELAMRETRLDGPALEEFVGALAGWDLESLDLGQNVLGEQCVGHLCGAACLRELKSLRIDRCEIPLPAAVLLAKNAPFIDTLRVLHAGHNHFGPAGLKALLERKPPSLHTLRMRDNDLFDAGAAALAESPESDALLELDLSRNGLGAAAARALGESQHLRGLLVLKMTDNPAKGEALVTLADSPLAHRLAVLELDSPPVSGDEIPF